MMAAKKRDMTATKLGEVKAEYRTRPKRAKSRVARIQQPVWGEVFWLAFQQLSADDQRAFIGRLFEDPDWFEDIYDSIMTFEAKKERGRPYEEFEKELRREGLL